MIVKNLKRTKCCDIGELIEALKDIPPDTRLECFCSNHVVVDYNCNQDDETEEWVDLDS